MNFDIFNGRKRAEARVANLQAEGYEVIDLVTLIHHWADMNNSVPATIESLEANTAFAMRLPRSGVVIRETVLSKAISAMESVYEEVDVQIVKKTNQVLWKHGEQKRGYADYVG
jgi:hypothetical protein